ncbi:MAG TPA: hypothetical protein VEA19_07525 [Actinomycetota bacterium]|nr:hypothetical protein [Actinomycetota bacterium]
MMRRILPVAICIFGLTACGGGGTTETPGSEATQAPSPSEASPEAADVVPAPPIEDAGALRDSFLELARANLDPDAGLPFGIPEAWQEAYPDLAFNGTAIDPDPSSVSVYANVQNSKNVEGPDNPYIVSFAIIDTGGTCTGGVIAGYPAPTEFEPVELTAEHHCDPLTVAAAGGYETFG